MNPSGLLKDTVTVLRSTITGDGRGGESVVWSPIGTLPARLSQPSEQQLQAGEAAGVTLTQVVYLTPVADVARRDRLTVDGRIFEVEATYRPSKPVYLRADCSEQQGTP